MNDFETVTQQIALTLGVSWAAGINLYAAIAPLGLLGATGHMQLPPGLEVLANPLVIGAAAVMYSVEFFADKIPGIDSAWDVMQTFIRIPAGAALAAGSLGKVDPAVAVAAGILGGAVAGSMHFAKAGILFEGISAAEDNTDVRGQLRLWPEQDRTRVTLKQRLALDTPVPWLLQSLIRSFVEAEAGGAARNSLANLRDTLVKA